MAHHWAYSSSLETQSSQMPEQHRWTRVASLKMMMRRGDSTVRYLWWSFVVASSAWMTIELVAGCSQRAPCARMEERRVQSSCSNALLRLMKLWDFALLHGWKRLWMRRDPIWS